MTIEQYSQQSGLSKDTLYHLIRMGGFPYVKVGTKYIVNDRLADEWFEQNRGMTIPGRKRG